MLSDIYISDLSGRPELTSKQGSERCLLYDGIYFRPATTERASDKQSICQHVFFVLKDMLT